jgi:PAS domain S-box-containing protein
VPGSLTDLAGLNLDAADFLAAVLEAAAQPIWVVDAGGVIRFANPASLATLGYDRAGELLGRHSHEAMHYQHPDGAPFPAAECPMLLPRTTGEVVRSDLDWFFRRDGSMFPVSYVSVPLELPEGRGAVVAFSDIEDRLRAEEVLREHDSVLASREGSLRRIATLVAGGAASTEVFAAIAREVAGVLGVPLVAVWRYESDGTGTVVGAWSEPPHLLETGSRWSLDDTVVISRVRDTGLPARSDELADVHGTVADIVREAEIRSAAGAPIVVDGDVWGVMAAGETAGERLPDRIEERLAEFTELVATAIANTASRAELARLADNLASSRARVVAAADEERRRVVRDLHDGAQQRLVHTMLLVAQARQALSPGQEVASQFMAQALAQAEAATDELRELAHGLLPEILTQSGLRAAVKSLALRTPVPVDVAVSADRLPAAVEATAYFLVAESLTNVAKHARATCATVMARVEDDTVRIQVRDDGVGGARPDGLGLVGLADRLAVLGCRLRVESPADGGTLVAAVIPLRD